MTSSPHKICSFRRTLISRLRARIKSAISWLVVDLHLPAATLLMLLVNAAPYLPLQPSGSGFRHLHPGPPPQHNRPLTSNSV